MRPDGAILLNCAARAKTFALVAIIALGVFATLLIAAGKDPLRAYADTLVYVFGNAYGFSELLVRMIPLLLTAVAAALPARIGLINVGAEGQLYMGAWSATAGALFFSDQPAFVLLPVLTVFGFVGGGLWALIPGVLRALRLVNETISTLLLNYVAPLIVSYFIFGPWRSPESASYPQSPAFAEAARLPTFFHSRVHLGLVYALAALIVYSLVMKRTRFGLDMRAIGGNPEAARRLGIPIIRYMLAVMFLAGGVAGLAGMAEVAAIQGRLVSEVSPGYGFIGFLVSWLAGTSASGIVRHSSDHPRRAFRGRQYSDGRHTFHRSGTPTRRERRAMNPALIAGVVASAVMSGTSLLYATLGEIVGERAGIVNLGLEGIMLIGAASGFAATALTASPYLGVAAAALAGAAANLIFAYVVVGRRGNQLAAGLSLMFFGVGLSALIGRPFVGALITGLPRLSVPGLDPGGLGARLLNYDILVYLALPTSLLIWWLVFRTRWGLGLRTVGESPAAAYAAGLQPELLQYQALTFAGLLGGIAGAHISVALTLTWAEGMTAGRGFIAIALVIFAKWNPLWAVAGALLFGGAESLQLQLQAAGADVSPFVMNMTPYLLTLLVLMLWGWRRQSAAPAALGRSFAGVE
jgi:ABC-type uncharacterized transport system permease subunit